MAKSFLEFKGKGFMMNDTFTELCLIYIINEIDKSEEIPDWLLALRNWWKFVSTGAIASSVELKLDEYLINEDRVNRLYNFIRLAQETVVKKGKYISVEELNNYVDPTINSLWDTPLLTDKVTISLCYLGLLVNSQILHSSSDDKLVLYP